MTTTELFSPPATGDYAEYYHRYVSLVPEGDFLSHLSAQAAELNGLLGDLAPGVDSTLHAPYTWTLKQVVGHLIDCERIFSTRLLHIGVGDPAALPSMDQNVYVANLDYESVTMPALLAEFEGLRAANVLLTQRMSAENLARRGVASDQAVSAKANLFILVGHVEYHAAIMRRRLGIAA